MFERSRRQNGTRISNSLAAKSDAGSPAAARNPAIENNESEQPKSLLAVYQGKPLRVTLRSLAPNTPGVSDGSDVLLSSTETEEDAASGSDVLEVQPARRTRSGNRNASAMRGERPRGYSHQRAAQIDFSSSASIEEHMPAYRGRGDLPFPVYRLLDARGNVLRDKKLCWKRVVDWRQLTQKRQRESIKSDRQLIKLLQKSSRSCEPRRTRTKSRGTRKLGWPDGMPIVSATGETSVQEKGLRLLKERRGR
jgi:hypothetical protein